MSRAIQLPLTPVSSSSSRPHLDRLLQSPTGHMPSFHLDSNAMERERERDCHMDWRQKGTYSILILIYCHGQISIMPLLKADRFDSNLRTCALPTRIR